MQLTSLRLVIAALIFSTLFAVPSAQAASQISDIPAWLKKHVGTGNGQIAPVVLQRARALYQRKVREGVVSNACYLAKDATRPNSIGGKPGRRFYIICESRKSFQAVSSGHGNGRKLRRAKFKNARQCARHFSNAEGSNLTAGGTYLTAETRTSFKGYYNRSGEKVPFYRTFLLFDGEGETSNSRERDIGGHQAVFLRWKCRFSKPGSANADRNGYVPYGHLVNYTGGRSNGCTTWSKSVSRDIIKLVEGRPTTLYIYPESRDINAVAAAVQNRKSVSAAGLYWNTTCLKAIRSPKFWPKSLLQPIIYEWRDSQPIRPHQELPICK